MSYTDRMKNFIKLVWSKISSPAAKAQYARAGRLFIVTLIALIASSRGDVRAAIVAAAEVTFRAFFPAVDSSGS